MEHFETLQPYVPAINEAMYQKFKLYHYNAMIKNIELVRFENNIYWESSHYDLSKKIIATHYMTPSEFEKEWKDKCDIIIDMFGVTVTEAKELFLRYSDELLLETKNMFIDALLKYLKDYVNTHIGNTTLQ